MRAKTIFIIIFTVLITVFLMINTDQVNFDFIFTEAPVSKLLVIGVCTFIGFILGYMAGRPKVTISTYDKESPLENPEDLKKSISDEDRDYIS